MSVVPPVGGEKAGRPGLLAGCGRVGNVYQGILGPSGEAVPTTCARADVNLESRGGEKPAALGEGMVGLVPPLQGDDVFG